ncbi:MAG: hypothetical protein M1816_003381 [Peltula sp. TS41687]|nr:MAG: hypothetical protein M1816_003381 [Peltula sp. TS41687]
MMNAQALLTDVIVATTAFLFTHFAFRTAKRHLETWLPTWNQVKPSTQNRLACEIALLPVRFVLFVCCAPAILNAFSSPDVWHGLDTSRTVLACAIMTGSYAYDLTIERADVLSLIHHLIAPTLLLWVRASFCTYTSSDAVMCRLLLSFVFFGAGVGGSLTTLMLVMMKLVKTQISAATLYAAVSMLSWALTVNTFVSTMFGSSYMLWWDEELVRIWGHYCFIPLFLSGFEFYLQWRWALRFQSIADELGNVAAGAGKKVVEVGLQVQGAKKQRTARRFLAAYRPKNLSHTLMIYSWGVSYAGVYASAVQKTFLRQVLA